ncbi:MAG: BatA domain-containing protein [Phycisphaerales bacterium]|nr:BatA domain-containing protein [Phycisphaerales bacterium]
MNFVHAGLAIAGLAAVAIPIIIHLLFRQRRRPIEWGAMRFLLEAYRHSRHRMRLEQWLLLAVRCLILALLGLALARPLLSDSTLPIGPGSRVVYLIIDNGLASTVTDAAGTTALEHHRRRATAIINTLTASDRVALVSAARPIEALVDPPAVDHAAVLSRLGEMAAVHAPTDLDAALNRVRESITLRQDDPSPAFVYLLSDFLSGSADLTRPLSARLAIEGRPVTLIASTPAAESVRNVQVTSIDSMRRVALAGATDLSGQFTVRLRRVGETSDEAVTVVRLSAEPLAAPPPATVRWSRGQSEATVDLHLDLRGVEAGEVVVTVSIDRDALAADNARFNILEVREALRVAVLDRREFGRPGDLASYPSGSWFRRALDPGTGSQISVMDLDPASIDRAAMRRLQAAILTRPDLVTDEGWGVLGEFLDAGGLLWIAPSERDQVATWTDLAASRLALDWRWAREAVAAGEGETDVALADDQPTSELLGLLGSELGELIKPVRVARVLPVAEGVEPSQVVLRLSDGSPWMVWSPGGGTRRGSVVYLASAVHLEWTSLPAKPFMVALVHEVVRQGIGHAYQQRSLAPGEALAAALPFGAVTLRAPGGESITILDRDGAARLDRPIAEAGVYDVLDERGARVGRLGVNVEPDAARTEALGAAHVRDWLAASGAWRWLDEAGTALAEETTWGEISLALLVAVLALTLLETILARWFSHGLRRELEGGGLDADRLALTSTLAAGGRAT